MAVRYIAGLFFYIRGSAPDCGVILLQISRYGFCYIMSKKRGKEVDAVEKFFVTIEEKRWRVGCHLKETTEL